MNLLPRRFRTPAWLFGLGLALVPLLAVAYDWHQFNGNSQHSGNNTQETTITKDNVSSLKPLPLVTLPNVADGSPVYQHGVSTSGGIKDLVFVTTIDGRILALDAGTGAGVWSQQPP